MFNQEEFEQKWDTWDKLNQLNNVGCFVLLKMMQETCLSDREPFLCVMDYGTFTRILGVFTHDPNLQAKLLVNRNDPVCAFQSISQQDCSRIKRAVRAIRSDLTDQIKQALKEMFESGRHREVVYAARSYRKCMFLAPIDIRRTLAKGLKINKARWVKILRHYTDPSDEESREMLMNMVSTGVYPYPVTE
jgi:hypothetical protein